MDQRFRLITAAAVMLLGVGLALFFRHPSAETGLPISMQTDPLVLRKQPDSRTFTGKEPAAAETPRRPTPTVVTPSDQPTPPPELPKSYPNSLPGNSQPASTRWGTSLREMLPDPKDSPASAPPTHKIIDGDSLAVLAQRYLGSASRAMEIYEANRDLLAQPEILPIGAELKIPRANVRP